MDLSSPIPTLNSPLTPVFGDNVQDLLNTGALQVNPSAIITVNSTNDAVDDLNSGVTTLRDAINQANADTGEDLIVFERSLFSNAQTIGLNLGELDITHNLDIIAPRDSLTGGDLVTVSGNKATRVFEIETGATVSIDGLIVADGSVTGDNGAGIKNSGALNLDSSIVRNNSATNTLIPINSVPSTNGKDYGNPNTYPFGGYGGGIYSSANLTVTNSTISGNSAFSGGGIYGGSTIDNSTISGNSASFYGGGIYGGGTIDNSTISNNSAVQGGGIWGRDTIDNSTISGNSAIGRGGGIYGGGSIHNSTISNNSAESAGGIYIYGGSTIDNSIISGNSANSYGGGIFHDEVDTLKVNNSTISGNSSAKYYGGSIYQSTSASTVTIDNSTISGNSAPSGGGIYVNLSTLKINNSTISSNSSVNSSGGGIYGYSCTLEVNNSTISGNSADGIGISVRGSGGGGIYNDFGSTATINNSTISGNSTNYYGGGILNTYSGTLTLLSSTITQNQAANGGGVDQIDVPPSFLPDAVRGSNNVRNTIIAANLNSDGGVNPDIEGTFSSLGYNLIGNSTGSTGFGSPGDIVGTSDNPIDPRLAPLDFYGGSTQTLALLPDSPAIDAADPTLLDTDPTTDQRGLPRISGGRADIGAFEFSLV